TTSNGRRHGSSASSDAYAAGGKARRGRMTTPAILDAPSAARRADAGPSSAPAAQAPVDPAHAAPLRPRRDRLANASLSSARVDAEAPARPDDEATAARRAAAARARGARADLREVRPGDID